MIKLNIPQAVLEPMLLRPKGEFICGAGEHRTDHSLELFVRPPALGISLRWTVRAIAREGLHPVFIRTTGIPWSEADLQRRLDEATAAGAGVTAALSLNSSTKRLQAHGLVRDGFDVCDLDLLWIPGPQMQGLRVRRLLGGSARPQQRNRRDESEAGGAARPGDEGSQSRAEQNDWFFGDRMSRAAGILGEETLRRASQLRVVVVGCGRLGSLLVNRLAMSGVGRQSGLVVADPDRVEQHNLDCMWLPQQAVGMPKTEAVARMMQATVPGANVTPLVAALGDAVVAEAVAASDVVFSAVDSPDARIGVAGLCARYEKPHFDATGGAAYVRAREMAIGGDIRVALPGRPGCVACFGHIGIIDALLRLSRSSAERQAVRDSVNWREQRPGSSGDVLFMVAGALMQEFFRVVSGRRRDSIWIHYHQDARDIPVFQDFTRRATRGCPVCSRKGLQGRGDGPVQRRWIA
jgi:hypothetical protein